MEPSCSGDSYDPLSSLIDGAYGQGTTVGAAGLKRELIETAGLLIDCQLIAK